MQNKIIAECFLRRKEKNRDRKKQRKKKRTRNEGNEKKERKHIPKRFFNEKKILPFKT